MREPFRNLYVFIYIICIFALATFCESNEKVKKSAEDNRDDGNGETLEDAKEDSLEIPVETEPANATCTRRSNSMMHEIRTASSGQFPFMAAIMSNQNEYLCAGTVVSTGLILTTAQCTQQSLSYVLLNATKDRKDDTTAMLHIIKTDKFPTYVGSESVKDVALIYTEKHNNSVAAKIKLSSYTSAQNVTDLQALGFGLNAESGKPKELQYIGIEHRPIFTPGDILPGYFDCVETNVLTCFKDTGGPVILNSELYGIVVSGQYECTKEMSSIYSINKKMVDILATFTFKKWLDERIAKNEDRGPAGLMTIPEKTEIRRRYSEYDYVPRSTGGNLLNAMPLQLFIFVYYFMLF